MIRAILFDLDGVLIDSFEAWYRLNIVLKKKLGLKAITIEHFKKNIWGLSVESIIKKEYPNIDRDFLYQYTIKNMPEYYKHVKVFSDTKKVLKTLKDKKIKLGLITNTISLLTLPLVKKLGLREYFETVVCRDHVNFVAKPAPDMILKAMKNLKVKASETLIVGDTEADILAARNANCLAVGYKTKGDKTIRKLDSIFKFV